MHKLEKGILPRNNYARWWFEKNSENNQIQEHALNYQPLISIVMPVYNAAPSVLMKAIK